MERRTVKNITIALARRAGAKRKVLATNLNFSDSHSEGLLVSLLPCMGKWLMRICRVTESMVGALFISFIQSTVAIVIMTPVPRKRVSVTMKDVVTPEGILSG